MNEHVLLTNARRTAHRDAPTMPPGASYDTMRGLWTLDGSPLVENAVFGPPTSKKADQETGEDQKGE